MPTTRAMARKGSTASEDKENNDVLTLRKKPVRRATAKATAPAATSRATKKIAEEAARPVPLSPKKVTQVAKACADNTISTSRTKPQSKSKEVQAPLPRRTRAVNKPTRDETDARPAPRRGLRGQTSAQSQVQDELLSRDPSSIDHENYDREYAQNLQKGLPDEPYQGHANLPSSPAEPSNINLEQPRATKLCTSELETDSTFDSDDELSGAKTTLHRNRVDRKLTERVSSPVKNNPVNDSNPVNELEPAQTPARNTIFNRQGVLLSQTQRIPTKPPGPSSPQRPLSVARGSSMVYVFHPLPRPGRTQSQPGRVSSPIKVPYQWPVTPSEEVDNPLEIANDTEPFSTGRRSVSSRPTPSRTQTTPSKLSPLVNRTPVTRERLVQLFASSHGDDDDSDEDEDEDDISGTDTSELATEPEEIHQDRSFSPGQTSADSDNEEEFDSPIVTDNQPTPRPHGNHVIDISSDVDDSSLIEPELDSELLESSPAQPAPIISLDDDDDEDEEDDFSGFESDPISTPQVGSVQRPSNSTTTDASVPTLSFSNNDGDFATPKATQTTNNIFKTPHMRSALDEFERRTTFGSSQRDSNSDGRTLCIDPSMLSQHEENHDLLDLNLNIQRSPASPGEAIPTLSAHTASGHFEPLVRASSPKKHGRDDSARLSMFLNTEDLCEDEGDDTEQRGDDATVLIRRQETVPSHMSPVKQRTDSVVPVLSPKSSVHHDEELDQATTGAEEDGDTQAQDTSNSDDGDSKVAGIPHYALPTIAYDSRRKSMPLPTPQTPLSLAIRPKTAGTAVKEGVSDNFARMLLERKSTVGSSARRQSMIGLTSSASANATVGTPLQRSSSRISVRAKSSFQNIRHSMAGAQVISTPTPAIESRPRCYTPTFRFSTMTTPLKLPGSSSKTPAKSPARSPVRSSFKSPIWSPIRSTFPSPAKSPARAPGRSPAKALKIKTPLKSPRRTPLKPAQSPSTYLFTPHPQQPLRAVVALVEVFTLDGSDASRTFVASLHRLGARTTKTWSERVTHVIFKDGSPTTLQRVRLANKDFADRGEGYGVYCVNSRWVTDCDREGTRMEEGKEEYVVDVEDVPRGGRRRRKSMEPASLRNLDGNVVPVPGGTGRKSLGRKEAGRSSLASTVWNESPVKGLNGTPAESKDFSEDDSWIEGTPMRQNDQVNSRVQQTMPVNRVRKFKLKELDGAARRRLTNWDADN